MGFGANLARANESKRFLNELVSVAGINGSNLPEIEIKKGSFRNPEVREMIWKYMSCGLSFQSACGMMGVSYDSASKMILKSESLQEEKQIADGMRAAYWEDVLMNVKFPPLVQASMQTLKAMKVSEWHTDKTEEPVVNNTIVEIKRTIVDSGKVIDGRNSVKYLEGQAQSSESVVSGLETKEV